jgi:hypothetical protein
MIPFSIEDFLQDQPQCKDLVGESLQTAYHKWLEDIHKELEADRQLSIMKDQDLYD